MVKLAAKAPTLNMIVAELALDLSRLEYELDAVTHIPGVTNTVADALSRVSMPHQEGSG